MNEMVMDASAILALLNAEFGHEIVAESMEQAIMNAVNLAEVVARLAEQGMPAESIREAIDSLNLSIMPFDAELAYAVGLLRPPTRALGLSLGDRACLALAQRMGAPALTADQAWKGLDVGVEIRHIR